MATYSRLSADDQNDQQRHQDSSNDEHGVNVVFHDRPYEWIFVGARERPAVDSDEAE
jgi:hypothetical protein